jgi:archaellum component FlaC
MLVLIMSDDKRFDKIDNDIDLLKKDVSILKTDVSQLKTDVSMLKTDVAVLKVDMVEVKSKLGTLIDSMTEWKSQMFNALDYFMKETKDQREFREIGGHQTVSNTRRIEVLEKKVFGNVL